MTTYRVAKIGFRAVAASSSLVGYIQYPKSLVRAHSKARRELARDIRNIRNGVEV